jgi:hypothetical protein
MNSSNPSIARRAWLALAAGAALGTPARAAVDERRGANLRGWTTVLGDGLYVPPGEAPLSDADIAIDHYDDASVLKANVRRRAAMAHHISYLPVVGTAALGAVHRVGFEFRLLALPSAQNPDLLGQTVEGGFFVWDGARRRLDLGAAFQWNVNPYAAAFGTLSVWRATPQGERYWQAVGALAPDVLWHRLDVVVDLPADRASLAVDRDRLIVADAMAREVKPGFGNDVTSRLQAEIVSVDPRPDGVLRRYHAAAIRNWFWQCGAV